MRPIWLFTAAVTLGGCFAARQKEIPPLEQKFAINGVRPLIRMDRGACYGNCPIYQVAVFMDGTVIYNGQHFVKQKGLQTSRISGEKVSEIIRAVKYARILESASLECETFATDYPTVGLTFTSDSGQIHGVEHHHGCGFKDSNAPNSRFQFHPQKDLIDLENKIDDIAGTGQWVGTPEDARKDSW